MVDMTLMFLPLLRVQPMICAFQSRISPRVIDLSDICLGRKSLKEVILTRTMKTAHFAAVVEAAGKPDTHLLLVSPEKDKALQAAIKTQRVMTVHQELVGNKADHGTVGFVPGPARQFLIFPKPISKFNGKHIVGINYDLLKAAPSEGRAKPAKALRKAPHKRQLHKKPERQELAHEKVIHFTKPELHEGPHEESEAIQAIKNQVRHAMELLEQGKQVAAFNLLKRIVDN